MNEFNEIYIKKAQKFAQKLASFEFIKLVAITGSLAKLKCSYNSDIDFFVVAKKGFIWTTRAICLLLSQILFKRAKLDNEAGKFCFNRFISDDYLEIFPRNSYHAHEYSSFIVIIDRDNTLEKFIAVNRWMKKFIKPDYNLKFKLKFSKKSSKSQKPSKFNEYLENATKDYQIKRFCTNKFYHQPGAKLVYNDREIYFFSKPQ